MTVILDFYSVSLCDGGSGDTDELAYLYSFFLGACGIKGLSAGDGMAITKLSSTGKHYEATGYSRSTLIDLLKISLS